MKIIKTANYKKLVDNLSYREKQKHVNGFEKGLKKILINKEKYARSKGPNMETLEKNKATLTKEERKKVMDAGATWNHGPNGEPSPAVWKSIVDGKDWYVCNTHRAFQCKPTLKGAIKSYDFIETTS